jgi:transglutaminase-like putative cysteine protease
MLRTAALAGIAGLVIAVNWLRFVDPRPEDGRPFLIALLAIAPALLRPLWLKLLGVAAATFVVGWNVLGADFLARFGRGFVDFYEFGLPFDPTTFPRSYEVLLAAIFAFVLAVALAIAARRPLLAVLFFLVGAGWPATLLAGGNELGRGAVILAVALILLGGLAERPSRLALGATGVVVVGALALSSSPAVAKTAFLEWEQWDFYNRPQKPVSVRYVWNADYGGISFPKKRTPVLTVRGPQKAHYWRATVLDRFDGTRWLEQLWVEKPLERLRLNPRQAADPTRWLTQEVTVEALREDRLIGATLPMAHDGAGIAEYFGQGVYRVRGGLDRGEDYRVWSYAPRPTPAQLARVRPAYPAALTRPGRELDLSQGLNAPPFGAPNREERLGRLLAGGLEPYADLYDRARDVTGETSSPYAAAVALETWFRTEGGFSYSEQPESIPGVPPLVSFVGYTKTGYCQHFAGGMAVMLRLLGIPARVAAGFVAGKYRDGAWRVTDHDAHAWVEVWFAGYGWLPFDPTPGRGRLSGTYSSTAIDFNARAAAALLAGLVRGGEVFGDSTPGPPRRNPDRVAGDFPEGIGLTPTAPASDRPSLLLFLLLLAAGTAGAIVAAKLVRRRIRYLTRNPRRIATACARELADFLHDQRVPATGAATFRELGDAVDDRLGVDASGFARAATAARYGPPEQAAAAARRARWELRALKRRLRQNLDVPARLRGLLSVRSLGLG